MPHTALIALALIAIWFGVSTVVEPLGLTATAQAQRNDDNNGSDDRDSSDRERRRGSWRDRFGDRDGDRGRGRDRDDDRDNDERRSDSGQSSNGASTSRGSTPSGGSSTGLDMRTWATSLVKQHDKNGDMILQPNEQSSLASSSKNADQDRDGMITIDELVMQNSRSSAPSLSDGPSSAASKEALDRDGNSSSGSDSAESKRVFTGSAGGKGSGTERDKRRSYRFSPAAERLPTGLPSWFKSRDKNSDGQVAMSEYGRTWSSRLVEEFRRYDTNDDGIITPKEVAK